MIDHVEAPFPLRPIDRGDVDQAPELAALVVAQKYRNRADIARVRRYGQLASFSSVSSIA
jgi:hypothetical protein